MLSNIEIKKAIESGDIMISPYDEKNLCSISYDMSIEPKLMVYTDESLLDTKSGNDVTIIEIPENGLVLKPGNLYLAKTKEFVMSKKYIPCITGRSTYARMGIQVHQTAFFANPGHSFQWILEISVVVPVIIYPDIKLSQMYFETIDGELPEEFLYHGKYKDVNGLAIPD